MLENGKRINNDAVNSGVNGGVTLLRTETSGAQSGTPAACEELTQRERQVLLLISEGYSTKEIAGRLGISFKTSACHRSRILAKFGVHNSVTLLRYAIRNGLIQV